MSELTTQTESFLAYVKAMMSVAPALCSLVCMLFILILMHDFRNSTERLLRLLAIVFFLIISILWFALFILDHAPPAHSLPDAPPDATRIVRIALSVVAFGTPAVVLILRYMHWMRLKRLGSKNILEKSTLRLLPIFAAAMIALLGGGIVLTFFVSGEIWDIVMLVIISLQQIWLARHIILRHHLNSEAFKLQPIVWNKKNDSNDPTDGYDNSDELTRRKIEEYFTLKRPYLDPGFKMPDLAEAMGVNRSEISAFVNHSFGMNFKGYVNRWRLAEYERLMALPSNELKNPYKVLLMAGFSDSRHFHRVVGQEQKQEQKHEQKQEQSTKQSEAYDGQ